MSMAAIEESFSRKCLHLLLFLKADQALALLAICQNANEDRLNHFPILDAEGCRTATLRILCIQGSAEMNLQAGDSNWRSQPQFSGLLFLLTAAMEAFLGVEPIPFGTYSVENDRIRL